MQGNLELSGISNYWPNLGLDKFEAGFYRDRFCFSGEDDDDDVIEGSGSRDHDSQDNEKKSEQNLFKPVLTDEDFEDENLIKENEEDNIETDQIEEPIEEESKEESLDGKCS